MKSEPKVRRDGKCVVCGKPLDIKPRATLNPLLYIDPFCSANCARSYYGTETKVNVHAWETVGPERLPAYDTCPDCGGRKKRASARCGQCARLIKRESKQRYDRSCPICGTQFETGIKAQRFCSRACANKHWHIQRKARMA